MQLVQPVGIDLPLKCLVWRDGEGKTWLAYNDPRWPMQRHGAEFSQNSPMRGLDTVQVDRD